MANIWADRTRETTTTTGTGALTLLGAPSGYQTFAASMTTSDTCYGFVADQSGGNWEVDLFTMQANGTLARTTVLASSNGGNLVNFGSGTKDVVLDLPAYAIRNLAPMEPLGLVSTPIGLHFVGNTQAACQFDVTNAHTCLAWGSIPGVIGSNTVFTAGIFPDTSTGNIEIELVGGIASAPGVDAEGKIRCDSMTSPSNGMFYLGGSATLVAGSSQAHFLRLLRTTCQALQPDNTYGIWCQYGCYVHATECTFNGMETAVRLDDFMPGVCTVTRCNGEQLRRVIQTWAAGHGPVAPVEVSHCRFALIGQPGQYALDFDHEGPLVVRGNRFEAINDVQPLLACRFGTLRLEHCNNSYHCVGAWTASAVRFPNGRGATSLLDTGNCYVSNDNATPPRLFEQQTALVTN